MSKLSNINQSNGNEIKIAVANTNAETILGCNNLPANTLIIAAEPDDNYNDTGIVSMFITDYLGIPVRLTYTIKEGNGLYIDNDELKLHIDNDTIKLINDILSCDIQTLIDNTTIGLNNDKITVVSDNLGVATNTQSGLIKIDNDTIYIINDCLEVNTANLLKASKKTKGICTSDKNTININNGEVSVNVSNLKHATYKSYGTAKPDNNTVIMNNDLISVDTNKLDIANDNNLGVFKTSKKIKNVGGILSVNIDEIRHASTDNYGIAKFNNSQFEIKNGVVSVKNYNNAINYIKKCNEKINKIKSILKN